MTLAVISRQISPRPFLPGLVKNIPSPMIVRHRSEPSHGYGSGIGQVQCGNTNGRGLHPPQHFTSSLLSVQSTRRLQVRFEANDGLRVNLTDARFSHLHDLSDFLHGELFIVIECQHQPFFFR